MKKQAIILFCASLLIIASTAGGISWFKSHQQLGKPGVKVGAVPLFAADGKKIADRSVLLPEKLRGYESIPLPINDIELKMLPADTTFGRRVYKAEGFAAMISVVLMGSDRTSIHKPQFCLTGQGWTIGTSELQQIKMERPLPYDLLVVKLTATARVKGKDNQLVTTSGVYVYWFVADNVLSADTSGYGRMISMARNVLRTGVLQRWAYVTCFSPCAPGDENATFEKMKKLIVVSAPEFQLVPAATNMISTAKN